MQIKVLTLNIYKNINFYKVIIFLIKLNFKLKHFFSNSVIFNLNNIFNLILLPRKYFFKIINILKKSLVINISQNNKEGS
jgi:hypothetical protein